MSMPPTIREHPLDELQSQITDLKNYVDDIRDDLHSRISEITPRNMFEKIALNNGRWSMGLEKYIAPHWDCSNVERDVQAYVKHLYNLPEVCPNEAKSLSFLLRKTQLVSTPKDDGYKGVEFLLEIMTVYEKLAARGHKTFPEFMEVTKAQIAYMRSHPA